MLRDIIKRFFAKLVDRCLSVSVNYLNILFLNILNLSLFKTFQEGKPNQKHKKFSQLTFTIG